MITGERLLVTGARGFLGSHLIAHAQREGWDAVAAYRGSSKDGAVSLDVCDTASVDAAFDAVAPSHVIHCAAYGVNYADQDPDRALAVNVHGALRVLDAAARHHVRRFVHVGSCFEYGSHRGPISEDTSLNPTAIYGSTKAAGTLIIRERAQSLGVPLLVARPFGMWGPGEAAHRLVPQIIAACLKRSPLKLTGCEVTRDYTYVEDMADRILSLLRADDVSSGTIINIGTGKPIVLRDFVVSIAKFLSGEDLMRFGEVPYRPTEMASIVADVTRMHQVLSGECRQTSLAEGLERMLAS